MGAGSLRLLVLQCPCLALSLTPGCTCGVWKGPWTALSSGALGSGCGRELGGLRNAPAAAVLSCSALTPFVSVPRSKSVQNKVDAILVSASVAHWAEGEGMTCLHLSPILAKLNPGPHFPSGQDLAAGISPEKPVSTLPTGWHPIPQPCVGQSFPVPSRGSSLDFICLVPLHAGSVHTDKAALVSVPHHILPFRG